VGIEVFGKNNQPLGNSDNLFRKAKPPTMGEKYGNWSGDNHLITNFPGGGALVFNLDRLTLQDFRSMRDHYQINASLSVLTFMLHQLDWHLESEEKKIASTCEDILRDVWTRLVRAKSQAFWAGRSPNVLQWENNAIKGRVDLTKIKDLYPEDCTVNWKKVEGAKSSGGATQWIKIYDGIRQVGWTDPIPVKATYWYPLLMENGNYYGKKILRSAFVPWFFSNLMHLYSNRYYERFGEPLPVGRAPFDEEVDIDGKKVRGNIMMGNILQQIRNRAAVVLPNQKTQVGLNDSNPDFDYQLEYLESQMRGVDFDRYITRLDEEITLGLFTPLLVTRTADVGSYNLGVGHMQTYQWMLNAIAMDWTEYINKYILGPMVDFNFSEKAPRAKIVFRKLGAESADTIRAIVTALIGNGSIKPDITELGEMAGLTLKEVQQVTEDPADPADSGQDPADRRRSGPRGTDEPRATAKDVTARVRKQAEKAFKAGTFGPGLTLKFGYERQLEQSLSAVGVDDAASTVRKLYDRVGAWSAEVAEARIYNSADDFMNGFEKVLDYQLEELAAA
jgi:hypothetical protein